MPFLLVEPAVPGSAKSLLASVTRRNISGRAIDYFKRGFVTGLVGVTPRAHPVMAEQHSVCLRIVPDQRFDHQTQVEARALPGHVDQVVPVYLFAKPLLIDRRCDSNYCVWMKMIDVCEWN